MLLRIVAAVLLTAIFFMAGIKKIRDFDGTVSQVGEKFATFNSPALYKLLTVAVITLELLAPLLIVYVAVTRQYRHYAYLASLALAMFTLIAAGLYYFPPTNDNMMDLMFHLGLAGGLIILALDFKSRCAV